MLVTQTSPAHFSDRIYKIAFRMFNIAESQAIETQISWVGLVTLALRARSKLVESQMCNGNALGRRVGWSGCGRARTPR